MSTAGIQWRSGDAPAAEVERHLRAGDEAFLGRLASMVDVGAYARKLTQRAKCFEAWHGDRLVALVAAYFDTPGRRAYITNVSVVPAWRRKGLSSALLRRCIDQSADSGLAVVELQVAQNNGPAIALYRALGFRTVQAAGDDFRMSLDLKEVRQVGNARNYDHEAKDNEGRRYAYGFDFDVMHPYMIRSFEPFFRQGSLLELGSYRGDFTRRLLSPFKDITCVEASAEALSAARDRLGDQVQWVHARFEEVTLPRRFDNVVLTHVLEHVDDPIRVLRRINDEWLTDQGRLFLVCPNANAPSRQIAVKMGLISHNAAVTPAESEHGHRCTYALDTLERDAVSAGLRVVHRSGIFFKALANFQWDRLLQTDIITPQYLEGCYMLGQQYPDLCSSIFLLCERGDPVGN